MLITLDTRENELIARCKHYKEISPMYKDIEFAVSPLPIGDVVISKDGIDLILIERKSISDLSASIKDGRYEEQSYRLNGSAMHNHNIVYLIEGDTTRINQFNFRTDKTTIYSAMFSLNHYKGFSVLRSMNLDESALIICNMAYKINREGNKPSFYLNSTEKENNDKENDNTKDNTQDKDPEESPLEYCTVVKKVKKENITPENIGEIVLSQIPIFGFLKSNTEKFLLILPKYWKRVSVSIVLIAAVITPTIDGYTQFLFAFSALSLCVYVLTSTQQRSEVQDLGLSGYFS
jgi:ERCC4-type nuclease